MERSLLKGSVELHPDLLILRKGRVGLIKTYTLLCWTFVCALRAWQGQVMKNTANNEWGYMIGFEGAMQGGRVWAVDCCLSPHVKVVNQSSSGGIGSKRFKRAVFSEPAAYPLPCAPIYLYLPCNSHQVLQEWMETSHPVYHQQLIKSLISP